MYDAGYSLNGQDRRGPVVNGAQSRRSQQTVLFPISKRFTDTRKTRARRPPRARRVSGNATASTWDCGELAIPATGATSSNRVAFVYRLVHCADNFDPHEKLGCLLACSCMGFIKTVLAKHTCAARACVSHQFFHCIKKQLIIIIS